MMTGTVADALVAAVAWLSGSGVPEPRADAEVLLAHALGGTRTDVIVAARRVLPPHVAATFMALVARRAVRVPVQYLVGEREFWSLALAVDRRVLIPRPETETLVETALTVAPRAHRVLDVGTGSGAIAAALARELPAATVVASDVDPDALVVARLNLARHAPAVRLVRGDLLGAFRAGAFDLVVSNPPYVADADLGDLAPEVRDHEPRRALSGGPDGLDVLRALVAGAPKLLVPGGWMVVEVGAGQAGPVRRVIEDDGRYARSRTVCDGAGVERVLAAERRADDGRT